MPKAFVEYLSNKQPQLRSLSIIQYPNCLDDFAPNLNGLESFSQLGSVSFASRYQEREMFGRLLQHNAHHLEEVKINYASFLGGANLQRESNDENQFVHGILRVPRKARSLLFQSLRKLTLSHITFQNGVEDLISAFNFPQLFSLKLRDCWRTNHMFDAIVSASSKMRLTSFELNLTGQCLDQYDLLPLTRFLRSFEGLEDLFLLCNPSTDQLEQNWLSALHHKSTLKGLVYQESTLYDRHEGGQMDRLWELTGLHCIGIVANRRTW